MVRYDFTAQAVEDLRQIGRHTKRAWGLAHARHYRQELELAVQKLSLKPKTECEREEIASGVRSYRVASHVAFYVQREGGITILRLLHPQMDVELAFAIPPDRSKE